MRYKWQDSANIIWSGAFCSCAYPTSFGFSLWLERYKFNARLVLWWRPCAIWDDSRAKWIVGWTSLRSDRCRVISFGRASNVGAHPSQESSNCRPTHLGEQNRVKEEKSNFNSFWLASCGRLARNNSIRLNPRNKLKKSNFQEVVSASVVAPTISRRTTLALLSSSVWLLWSLLLFKLDIPSESTHPAVRQIKVFRQQVGADKLA